MTTARQLIGMIRSHAAGDHDRFLSIVEEVANEAQRAGKKRVADDIHKLLANVRSSAKGDVAHFRPTPLAKPRGELAGLIKASYPDTRLGDLVLNPDLSRKISRIVREQREHEALEAHGLLPRKRFLLSGPPGTGKTMTAAAIAGELSMPLFTVLLDGVINKYMGESAAKLRLIFEAMHNTRGVYFFDEVDALATARGNENDVGEARRVLTSFLQFLEEDTSRSIIIAATNLRTLLDPAIFRRFQGAFAYAKPSRDEARALLRHHLLQFDRDSLDWEVLDGEMKGLSQADLASAADDAARDAVLEQKGRLTTEFLVRALRDRGQLHTVEEKH
jgi:SpoVK/Ycf46/Vps4 family AAA+-type ATPase